MPEELFATDAYRRSLDAAVVATDRDAGRVALGRTAFYPGGGGQPPTSAPWTGATGRSRSPA